MVPISNSNSFSPQVTMVLKQVFKLFKYFFLLTLPLTFLPIGNGIIGGVLFSFWNNGLVKQHVDSLTHEIEQDSWLDSFSVPGALSIHDFMDQKSAFHVPKLKTNDWLSKLGYMLPNEYIFLDDAPIDKLASLDNLMLDTTCSPNKPTEQWVYVSSLAWPSMLNEWDAAFDQLIRNNYVSPLSDTSFAYVECASSEFLCGIWGVKAPTMLHFKIEAHPLESEDMPPDLTYEADRLNLRPVTVRIIELPLEEAYTGTNAFLGPFEQLRAIIRGNCLYEQFDTYNPIVQLMNRFNDHIQLLMRRYRALDYFYKAHNWIDDHIFEPLGMNSALDTIKGIAFQLSMLLAWLVRLPFSILSDAWAAFFGVPDQFAAAPKEYGNLFDNMLGGFLDSFDSRFDGPTAGSPWDQTATAVPSPAPT